MVQLFMKTVKPHESSPFLVEKIETDDMKYIESPLLHKLEISENRFFLHNNSHDLKITISYVWSQSTTLAYYRKFLNPLIAELKGITIGINSSQTNISSLSKKYIKQLTGRLYQ